MRRFHSLLIGFAISLSVIGCAPMASVPVRSTVPQSEEVSLAGPIKLRIASADWIGESLVVKVAMTNTGSAPLMPSSPILFQLRSADGKTYIPEVGAANAANYMFLASGTTIGRALNPGRSEIGTYTFIVPKSRYELVVQRGALRAGAVYPASVAWVWELSSIGGN